MSGKGIKILVILLTALLAAGLLTCSVAALRTGAADIGPFSRLPQGGSITASCWHIC